MNFKVFISFLIFSVFSLNSMQELKRVYILNKNGNIDQKEVVSIQGKTGYQLKLKQKAIENEFLKLNGDLFKKIISNLPFKKKEINYNFSFKENDKRFIHIENLKLNEEIFIKNFKIISFFPIFNRYFGSNKENFIGFMGLNLFNEKKNENEKVLFVYNFSKKDKYNIFFIKEALLHDQISLTNIKNKDNYENIISNKNNDNFFFIQCILCNYAHQIGDFQIEKVYFDEKDKDVSSKLNFYFNNKEDKKLSEFSLNISNKEAYFYFDSTQFENLKDWESFQHIEDFKIDYPLISKYLINPFFFTIEKGFNEKTQKNTITYLLNTNINKKEGKELEKFLNKNGSKYTKTEI